MTELQIIAGIGFILSAYALYVDIRHEKDRNYKPGCDISSKISCSKAFFSKYGKTFGILNPAYGLVFYVAVFALDAIGRTDLVLYLAGLATLGSIYLAYILYAKVKSLCVICNSIYLVNILLFIGSLIKI